MMDYGLNNKYDNNKDEYVYSTPNNDIVDYKGDKNFESVDFMQEAIIEAKKAYINLETPIGAVIVRNNEIISRSNNQVEKLKDPTAHAEILAIRNASKDSDYWRLFDCTMYVTLEPCLMCVGAIINSNIKKVVIGCYHKKNSKVDTEVELALELLKLNKVEVEYDLRDECQKLLTMFFSELRKIKNQK